MSGLLNIMFPDWWQTSRVVKDTVCSPELLWTVVSGDNDAMHRTIRIIAAVFFILRPLYAKL